MFSLFDLFLLVIVLIVGFIAWQAHHKHNSFAAQTKLDLSAVNASIISVEAKAKTDLVALEGKIFKSGATVAPSGTAV